MVRILVLPLVAVIVPVTAQSQTNDRVKAKRPAAGSMFSCPERIALKNGTMFTARRGLMFVPLNRSKPDSEVISIEFYHFPSLNPKTKAPPLFMLNGGPGFEGLEGE